MNKDDLRAKVQEIWQGDQGSLEVVPWADAEAELAECEAEREAAQKRFEAASELSAARGVEISELRERLAECEREKGWQLIETAAPDQIGLFWLDWAPKCGGIYPVAQSDRIHFGKRECWASIYQATHWMPLPEPPAALTEAGEQPAGVAQLTEVLCSDNLDSDAIEQDLEQMKKLAEAGEQERNQ